jgi:hypothetical protein
MAINSETARTMAKNWRAGTRDEQRLIERCITARHGWTAFRYGRDGSLIARITPADRARTLGADCHSYSDGSPI